VFQQSRFANYFLKVKEVIASGVLGRIVHVGIQFNGFARRWDWQCCLDFNGGNLANTGPHPVDQALNILDAYDKELEIFCKMDRCNTFGNAEDYVKLIVTAPDRPLIDLDITSCDAYPSYTYKVEGTNGTLKGSMAHIDWKYFKPEEAPEQKLIRTPLYVDEAQMPAYCGEKLTWYEESWDGDPQAPFIAAVQTYYDQIYELLLNGREHDIKLFQVRQQLDLIRKCHEMNPQIC
jgi:predicted dehydrogenase